MKTAIVYGSGFTGHTRKIAENIGSKIGADVFNIKEMGDFNFADYERVIIGTNVYFKKPHKKILDFANQHSDCIANKSPKLFIVCGARGKTGEKQAEKIATMLTIEDYAFFNGQKDANGKPLRFEEFVSRL